jgi:hemolysin activation/secretion protein
VLSPRLSASIGYASNDFVLGAGNSESINNLKLEGKTQQTDIAATYRFKRSRTQNYFGVVLFERIKSIIRLGALPGAGDVGLDDTIRNLSLVFRYDILAEESKILHQGDVKLTTGEFLDGAEVGQDEKYNILNANYTLLTFWNLPYFEASTRLIYRASLQYASSPLSSISQFTLAGPTKARGYPINQFSADNALYLGIDWVFEAPEFFDMRIGHSNLRSIARPFVFVDASWGEVLSLVGNIDNSTGQLIDVGAGIQFSYLDTIRGNVQLAFPVNENFSSDDVDIPTDSVKLVMDIQYSF